MALTEKIKLQGKAGLLGIEGYRTMSVEQLTAAIKAAEKAPAATPAASTNGKGKSAAVPAPKGKTAAATPPKGKTTTPTAPAPPKGKTSAATPPKGKGKAASASTSAPAAESTARKPASSPKGKAAAATGKVERPTAGGKGKTTGTAAKGKAAAAAPKRQPRAPRNTGTVESFKATIDNSKINWKAESNVGQSGKRKDVLDSLRKHKGDRGKVFEELKGNAVKWYPNAHNSFPNAPTKKHASERMLVWLIGRVAYDFAKKTGQHEDGKRIPYGTSTDPRHERRRQAREEAAKARGDEPRAQAPKGKTPARAPRPAAPKGKTQAPARKPAAQAPAKKPAARGKTQPAAPKGKAALRGVR